MRTVFTEASKQNDNDVIREKTVQPTKGNNAPGKYIYSEQFKYCFSSLDRERTCGVYVQYET